MSSRARVYVVLGAALVAIAALAFMIGRGAASDDASSSEPRAADKAAPQRIRGLSSAPTLPTLQEPAAPAPPATGISPELGSTDSVAPLSQDTGAPVQTVSPPVDTSAPPPDPGFVGGSGGTR